MKTKTLHYVEIKDYCESNGMDYSNVMENVSNSDASYGNNADTFITAQMLADIMETEVPSNVNPDLLISLGC